MTEALDDYTGSLYFAIFGVLFVVGGLFGSWLLGQRGRSNAVKNTPYECGLPVESEAHARFSVKFYIVAMLFILFDVEVVFMYPWAVSFAHGSWSVRDLYPGTVLLLVEAGAFVAILFLGWVYVVKKGVLEWHVEE
jgi:NADH-quinone oxidoreductase subunit A